MWVFFGMLFHVLQLLPIRFRQQILCYISKYMKFQQKLDWEFDFPWFSYGYRKCMCGDSSSEHLWWIKCHEYETQVKLKHVITKLLSLPKPVRYNLWCPHPQLCHPMNMERPSPSTKISTHPLKPYIRHEWLHKKDPKALNPHSPLRRMLQQTTPTHWSPTQHPSTRPQGPSHAPHPTQKRTPTIYD